MIPGTLHCMLATPPQYITSPNLIGSDHLQNGCYWGVQEECSIKKCQIEFKIAVVFDASCNVDYCVSLEHGSMDC